MTQLTRRIFTLGAAIAAGSALTGVARAQYPYAPPPPPPFGGPPPDDAPPPHYDPRYDPRYPGPRADDGERRFGPPGGPQGGPGGQHWREERFNREVFGIQEERNRRVRDLQEQYNQRRINRYQLDQAVNEETHRMNERIEQRRREEGF